ncbi:MAG: SDR family NAD(P)-dependent oxidoreductase, partial [Anaerolineae bacterium]|nr:SDR family NAD(P)-dependent oxidoreductase [Anaerolineae bacterium]
MARFTDRVALITGGAQGIGRATAERLVEDGARVVLVDQDLSLAELTAEELSRAGGQASAIACDIAQREQVRAAMAETIERHGRLDILVANAGIAAAQPFLELDDGHWERVLAVN